MSERAHAARIVLAVQAALQDDEPARTSVTGASYGILRRLHQSKTGPLLIADVVSDRGSYHQFTALKQLQDEGLVEVDADAGTIVLTSTGESVVAN